MEKHISYPQYEAGIPIGPLGKPHRLVGNDFGELLGEEAHLAASEKSVPGLPASCDLVPERKQNTKGSKGNSEREGPMRRNSLRLDDSNSQAFSNMRGLGRRLWDRFRRGWARGYPHWADLRQRLGPPVV